MLKKCDFCNYYDPSSQKCLKQSMLFYYSSSYCANATKAFERYVNNTLRSRSTHTKNVNVNKHIHHKKR